MIEFNDLKPVHRALAAKIRRDRARPGAGLVHPRPGGRERSKRAFAHYHGVPHAVAVANGTDAIELALRAGGVGPGDEVITVAHTAVATVCAIERAGAVPVLVDIDPRHVTR